MVQSIPGKFSYGGVFNAAASESKGDFLAVIAAHALPSRNDWLDRLSRHFCDPSVAGVFGRQLPYNTHPCEERITFASYPERGQPVWPVFSTTNAMIRRSVWSLYPFNEQIVYNDDIEWALRVKAAGYKIVYEPEAPVYHSHAPDLKSIYKNYLCIILYVL